MASNFGLTLIWYRESRQLTRAEFATILEVAEEEVIRWEEEGSEPTTEMHGSLKRLGTGEYIKILLDYLRLEKTIARVHSEEYLAESAAIIEKEFGQELERTPLDSSAPLSPQQP